MKRYIVFGYTSYEAYGGWNDVLGSFDNESDAIAHLDWDKVVDAGHVIDSTTGETVYHK